MNALALLVIDVQIGAFDGKLLPAIPMGDDLLSKIEILIGAARKSDVPVIYIQHCAADGLLVKDTEAWPIHPLLAPRLGDLVIEKQASSAFENTELDDALSKESIEGIILCGLQSELCISNTALDALDSGMRVYVCSDAHSTWATEEATAMEIKVERNEALSKRGATVVPTATVVSLFQP